jgi:hypothetical protein
VDGLIPLLFEIVVVVTEVSRFPVSSSIGPVIVLIIIKK